MYAPWKMKERARCENYIREAENLYPEFIERIKRIMK